MGVERVGLARVGGDDLKENEQIFVRVRIKLYLCRRIEGRRGISSSGRAQHWQC